jgi:hypothetical protein
LCIRRRVSRIRGRRPERAFRRHRPKFCPARRWAGSRVCGVGQRPTGAGSQSGGACATDTRSSS